jgi:hypothetical protein
MSCWEGYSPNLIVCAQARYVSVDRLSKIKLWKRHYGDHWAMSMKHNSSARGEEIRDEAGVFHLYFYLVCARWRTYLNWNVKITKFKSIYLKRSSEGPQNWLIKLYLVGHRSPAHYYIWLQSKFGLPIRHAAVHLGRDWRQISTTLQMRNVGKDGHRTNSFPYSCGFLVKALKHKVMNH